MNKIDEIKKQLTWKVKDASNTNTIFDTRKYLLYDDVIKALNEVLIIDGVSSSLDEEMTIEEHLQNIVKHRKRAKTLFAIKTLKNADCQSDILNAIALKEELNWLEVDDELKDRWNDYFGDAKKYLP